MPFGRKSYYNTMVKPKLDEVKKWRAGGLFDYQIAKKLGIGLSTFYEYKVKYPEFTEALKVGNKELTDVLKNKLIEKAMGFKYTEEKTYKKKDLDGKEWTYIEITEKQALPDVAALHLALKNFDKDDDGKHKWTNDPAMYDLRREELELKKQMAESGINDWRAIE